MKKHLVIFLVLIISSITAEAQNDSKVTIGAFYTATTYATRYNAIGKEYELWDRYLNINSQLRFKKNWRIGFEFNLANVDGENVDNPFYLTGLTLDYDLLRSKEVSLYLRTGVSYGNLSFAGEEDVAKRIVVNRIIGISASFKLYKFLIFYGGFYNHFPLNKIENKFGISQPFIGLGIRL
ncbi:MAG: hypothetical protein ABI851_02760 [Saprospiraceae bacterium]